MPQDTLRSPYWRELRAAILNGKRAQSRSEQEAYIDEAYRWAGKLAETADPEGPELSFDNYFIETVLDETEDVPWAIPLSPRSIAASAGGPIFRIAFGRSLHISGWPAILLAPLAIPVVILLLLSERLFGLRSTADLTAKEVEKYLRDFLDGRSGAWDWDDFTSIAITDATLDAIREQAAYVQLPLDGPGRATLEQLLEQVRAL